MKMLWSKRIGAFLMAGAILIGGMGVPDSNVKAANPVACYKIAGGGYVSIYEYTTSKDERDHTYGNIKTVAVNGKVHYQMKSKWDWETMKEDETVYSSDYHIAVRLSENKKNTITVTTFDGRTETKTINAAGTINLAGVPRKSNTYPEEKSNFQYYSEDAFTKKVTIKYARMKKLTLNGKEIKSGKTVSASGKYSICAIDTNGTKMYMKFIIDRTKPEISGVKNGKTYKGPVVVTVQDKESGISEQYLDGIQKGVHGFGAEASLGYCGDVDIERMEKDVSTIKVKCKSDEYYWKEKKGVYTLNFKKSGKYVITVKDMAGNVNKVSFTIK